MVLRAAFRIDKENSPYANRPIPKANTRIADTRDHCVSSSSSNHALASHGGSEFSFVVTTQVSMYSRQPRGHLTCSRPASRIRGMSKVVWPVSRGKALIYHISLPWQRGNLHAIIIHLSLAPLGIHACCAYILKQSSYGKQENKEKEADDRYYA